MVVLICQVVVPNFLIVQEREKATKCWDRDLGERRTAIDDVMGSFDFECDRLAGTEARAERTNI